MANATGSFAKTYERLNAEQRKAVDAVDGPLLVLAGPGTGKTQLLSARVANIMLQTDTLAHNILCLTFTDAAALNMRERLISMIGEAAYDVHIGTYHSFASEIIRAYPDFFQTINLETGEDSRLEQPVSELGQLEIIQTIIESLPFTDPMRSAKYYLKSVVSTISDFKQANLAPDDVRRIAKENGLACLQLSHTINDILGTAFKMPRKVPEATAVFVKVYEALQTSDSALARMALDELTKAIASAEETGKTNTITQWKNDWLLKDEQGNWTFTNPESAEKMLSLASIYERYQKSLVSAGQYDFNDMILRTIAALKDKPELRFNLQERYQYILLDEFQDTNAAQFELVTLLANHPVHEGRPNVMAVGDDDQGIFAFQGANIGNMVQFLSAFKDVAVINLIKNYRSHRHVLHVAHNIAEQIETRLHHNLVGISKDIEAAASGLPDNATIARHEFNSQAAEYGWVAEEIQARIAAGAAPSDIAVLAPKHILLEQMVPFLNKLNIPVVYDKRENIFETVIVQSILLVCEFLQAASNQDFAHMDELLPKVLSLDFWEVPTQTIWQLNWQYDAQRHKDEPQRWTALALANEVTKTPVLFLLELGGQSTVLGLEQILDYITGAKALAVDGADYTAPLKNFYFSADALTQSSLAFYESISHLSVIRDQLRSQQSRQEDQLAIADLLTLYRTYQEAETPLINTHPIAQADSAVVLQTVYKAKGLEYDYVYLPCMHDDVWGSTTSGGSNKISLPRNLEYVRYDASGDDNLRRLLFVAVTRAKYGLTLTSHALKENGKKTMPVKYLHESDDENGRVISVYPDGLQQVAVTGRTAEQLSHDVDTLWHSRHLNLVPSLKSLLRGRLERYVMSPTHLNTFTNLEWAGPQSWLLNTLLRFPEAPTPDSIYGSALHNALETYQKAWQEGKKPTSADGIKDFERNLGRAYMSAQDKDIYLSRGRRALKAYLAVRSERLKQPAGVEVDFRREGVTHGDAILTGKIDRLEVDKANKTVKIIDFKSGFPSTKWGAKTKLYAYEQQLYFYMLLVEQSVTYRGYTVASAELDFIEPMSNGQIADPLVLVFNQAKYDEFKQLILAVWARIQALELPDVSGYSASAPGMKKFVADLIA